LTKCSAKMSISSEVKTFGDGVGYCGKYKDDAKLKVVVLAPNQTFYFSGLVDGKLFYCNRVPFEIMANGTVYLQEFFSKQSCLGGLFSYYGVNPYSVSVTYDFSRDIATVSGPSNVSFSLSPCSGFYRKELVHSKVQEDEMHSWVAETNVKADLADPSGSYCGEYLLILKLKATVVNLQEIALSGSLFGFTVSCPSEVVEYIASNGSIFFPNINKTGDCLGGYLKEYSINPNALNVTYATKANTVTIEVDGVIVILAQCTTFQEHFGEEEIHAYIPEIKNIQDSKSHRDFEKANPSGEYFGQYQSTVSVTVTVLSLSMVDINGSIEGVGASCTKETVKYDSSTNSITFPNITAPADCLGLLLTSFGLDPTSLKVSYDPLPDEILVSINGISISLTKKASI